jgi:hypothetical protein|tara:strand:- start:366 stop:887 length:522 start_codon:yes stop_codon:yes gene_type:complete
MSDDLIGILDNRISELENELKKAKSRKDNLIKATKSNGLAPMRYEIERTIRGWNLTLPLNKGFKTPIVIEELESLKACVALFSFGYKKAQFRNQPFELYDHNTKTLFRDYRVYTEWVEKADGEIKDVSEEEKKASKKASKQLVKKVRKSRMSNIDKVQKKVKKIDTRIFDRTY